MGSCGGLWSGCGGLGSYGGPFGAMGSLWSHIWDHGELWEPWGAMGDYGGLWGGHWGSVGCPPSLWPAFFPPQKREAFCQLLQLMKNKHSHQDEPDMISIFIGTWNMGQWGRGGPSSGAEPLGTPHDHPPPLAAGSVPPPKSLASWFTCKGLGKTLDEVTVAIPHDIYVFGTQENSLGDREWVEFLRGVLKDFTEVEYRPVRAQWGLGSGTTGWWRWVGSWDRDTGGWWRWVRCWGADTGEGSHGDGPQVAMQSLWNIKVVVLVKPEHENRISHVSTSSVKTGIANTLGRGQGCVGRGHMDVEPGMEVLDPAPLVLPIPAGNKGAVGVSFMFNGTSFGFVNCHLTSGNEKTAR